MSTPQYNHFSKLEDEELQNLIKQVLENIDFALKKIQGCWQTMAGLQEANHYRKILEQGTRDLESMLTVWNYRQESMR